MTLLGPKGGAALGWPPPPGALVQSPWGTQEIALRHDFVLGDLPDGLVLSIHHDEDALVFLNGIQVAAFDGFRTDYIDVQLPSAALDALVVGSNTLAVLCRQTTGGQYIDVGLRTGWLDSAEATVGAFGPSVGASAEHRAVQSLLDALDQPGPNPRGGTV